MVIPQILRDSNLSETYLSFLDYEDSWVVVRYRMPLSFGVNYVVLPRREIPYFKEYHNPEILIVWRSFGIGKRGLDAALQCYNDLLQELHDPYP